jgi:hypothetical protein
MNAQAFATRSTSPLTFFLLVFAHSVPSRLLGSVTDVQLLPGLPMKQLVWFERSAHLPNTEEKDQFNECMIKAVLPRLAE